MGRGCGTLPSGTFRRAAINWRRFALDHQQLPLAIVDVDDETSVAKGVFAIEHVGRRSGEELQHGGVPCVSMMRNIVLEL